jgi:hypothetical protein
MQETLDKIIDEINNDIIPAGEDLLRTTVETVEEEPEDPTEDPVERLIRPHRERNEPVRLTYSNFSTTDGTVLENTISDTEIPKIKHTYAYILKRNMKRSNERRNDIECKHNLFQQAIKKDDKIEYWNANAVVAGHFISELTRKYTFGQQFTFANGLQKFGEKGIEGTEK